MLFALSAIIISCDEDQQTGESLMSPTSPTISIVLDGGSSTTLIEDDSTHGFTVSLSETQIVDVKLHVSQIGGTAGGSDYEMTSLITIPAGYTSASGSITILSDALIEDTETLQIQIGSVTTANAALTPITTEFTILNYTDGDLVIDMSWAMSIATNDAGEEMSATDFADLRLLLTDAPTNQAILGGADGGSFETYVLSAGSPDGDYYLVADFYAASEIVRDIDLMLEINQAGVINGDTYSYPAALNNEVTCGPNFFVMMKITKAGDNYTFEDVSTRNLVKIEWNGTDVKDFYAPDGWASHVVTNVDCTGGLTISGLNAEWMLEVWGEVIEEEGTVYYTVDGNGVVTIEEQYVFTTSYSGSLYDYTVSGTGTLDLENGTFDLQYNLFQDGWSVDGYWFGAGGLTTPYFEANLTID